MRRAALCRPAADARARLAEQGGNEGSKLCSTLHKKLLTGGGRSLAAFLAAAMLAAVPASRADDIPWTMTNYSEPVAVSAADSAELPTFTHAVWSLAESSWTKLLKAFATIILMK